MLLGYVFSLIAAVLWGTNHVLIRLGVTGMTTPLVGATLSTMVGALLLSTVAARNYGPVVRDHRKSLVFILLAGATAAMGLTFQFLAFSVAPVIVVSPVSCTYPIITVVLARFFLKKTEIITPRVVIGAVCVVVGVALIAVGRP